MSLREEMEMLRNLPLFSQVEPSKLKLIAFTSERLLYRPGHNLCAQGEMGDSAFVIIRGTADVILETERGELKISTLGQNDIVGEISVLCDVPRTATVRAATEVDALRISKEQFTSLLQEFPQISADLLRELARRLEITTAKLRDVSMQD